MLFSSSPLFLSLIFSFVSSKALSLPAPEPAKQALPPLPNAIIADLQTRLTEKFTVVTHGPKKEHLGTLTDCDVPKSVAFNYDDGVYKWASELDDLFKPFKGAYTKFINGANWMPCIYDQEEVDSLRASYAAGALIGSHTWSHADLNTLTHDQIDQEIEAIEIALYKILGIVPRILRPPYGSCNDACAAYINKRHGYVVVNWSVDSADSMGATPDASIATLTAQAANYPAPVLPLMHETYQSSVEQVSPAVVPIFKKAGYELMTVAECLKESPYKLVGKPQKRDETWTCSGALPYKGM